MIWKTSKSNPLFIVLILSLFLAACNPQDPDLDETTDQTEQEEVKVDPTLPNDPGADEVIGEETEDEEQVNYSVQMTFNKKAYGFYTGETQVVSGTVSSTTARGVRLSIDGRIEKLVAVSSRKFSMSLTFFDAAMGNLVFEALDANENVVGKKTIFYQVVRRPIDGGGVGTDPDGDEDKRNQFSLSAPNLSGARKMTLWATSYWLPQVDNKDSGFALRDLSGNSLGATVTRREWCNAAMEGSIQVRYEDGHLVTYNYAGTSSSYQVDCSAYYSHSPSHKVKFREANGEYGDGVRDYELVPHRSIAVDPNVIPYGSVVYIPAAKGNTLKLPNGETFVHDGYYYAVDTGGLIKQNHIDVFRGTDTKITQSWIKSSSSGTFTAYIVDDMSVSNFLDEIHH